MRKIRIGFGGGCHWCSEAVFQSLRGVWSVEQGYIASPPPSDSYSEAVIVTFNPDVIPQESLIEIHLRTHASTSQHNMREKYRSAVYTFSADQGRAAKEILRKLQSEFPNPLVTSVLSFVSFKPTDEQFQNYYNKNADSPFCTKYIDPKLNRIREQFSEFYNPD